MDRLTTADVAEKVGRSPSTIKAWQPRFGIPVDIKKGKAFYSEDTLAVFEAVRDLITEGAGDQTIRRKIGTKQKLDNSQPSTSQSYASPETDQPQAGHQPAIGPDMSQLIPAITQAVEATVARNNELAQQYARASHRVGELEAENRGYAEKLNELRALLPAPGEMELLQAELERTKLALAEEQKKTWWQKLFGG